MLTELLEQFTPVFLTPYERTETFTAETEMIPISWNGYSIAYHFVREIR